MSDATLSSIILLLNQSAIISAILAISIIWRQKKINLFSLLMMSCTLWAFAYARELDASLHEDILFWVQVEYLSITTVPVFWFLYIVEYTNRTSWITPARITALLSIPFIINIAVWTNDYHLLIWSQSSVITVGEVTLLSNSYGPLFWVHTIYSYLLVSTGTVLLFTYIAYFPKKYHARIISMLLATSAPWISNVLYLTGIIPFIDTTPIAFIISGILMIWSIFRMDILSTPIAYHTAIENLSDGVMLIDTHHKISEVNIAMARFLHRHSQDIVGQNADTIFNHELPLSNQPSSLKLAITLAEDVKRHVDLQISPILTPQNNLSGHVIVAHDITAQHQVQDNMRYMLQQIEAIKKEWEITADSLDQLICLINEDGIVLRSNLAVENWGLESITRVKGQALTSLVGEVYRDLAQDIGDNWETILSELKLGKSYYLDVKDTQLGHYFEVRFEPLLKREIVHHISGTSIAVVSIYDVTKRKHLELDLQHARELAEREHQKSEELLLNILPQPIAERLKANETVIADNFDEVTVLFADIVGFTKIASRISATELVERLNEIFSAFDDLALKHNLEKIKTLGDAYMVAGGIPLPQSNHAVAIAALALDMQTVIQEFAHKYGEALNIRIGIHTGSVVAGVIGTKKFAYDLWGDTVNIASRMESHGIEGTIQVSEATYQYLVGEFQLEERGYIQIKNKEDMKTYFLTGQYEVSEEEEEVSEVSI
ncbi:MAG: adenylate/guanylate cyclase domain-containing protein [Phototrophicaceae bacterium]